DLPKALSLPQAKTVSMQLTLTSAYVCGRIVRRRPSCGHVDNATALPTGPQLAAAKPDLYRFKRRNSGGFRSTREGQLSGGWGRFHPRFLPTRHLFKLRLTKGETSTPSDNDREPPRYPAGQE